MFAKLLGVPLTMLQRHEIRNKLQLIMSYAEMGQPANVIIEVRAIDQILGGKHGTDAGSDHRNCGSNKRV